MSNLTDWLLNQFVLLAFASIMIGYYAYLYF